MAAAQVKPAAGEAEVVASGSTLRLLRAEAGEELWALSVGLRNRGDRPAGAFAFDVEVDGQVLAALRDRVFLQALSPGVGESLQLYTFWRQELAAGAGPPVVSVALREAWWLDAEDLVDGEAYRLDEQVQGLPSATTAEVQR
jgi:hypothetical protein